MRILIQDSPVLATFFDYVVCNIVEAKTSGVTLEQTDLDETDFEDKMRQMNIRDSTDAEPIPKRHEKADMIKAFATVPGKVEYEYTLIGQNMVSGQSKLS